MKASGALRTIYAGLSSREDYVAGVVEYLSPSGERTLYSLVCKPCIRSDNGIRPLESLIPVTFGQTRKFNGVAGFFCSSGQEDTDTNARSNGFVDISAYVESSFEQARASTLLGTPTEFAVIDIDAPLTVKQALAEACSVAIANLEFGPTQSSKFLQLRNGLPFKTAPRVEFYRGLALFYEDLQISKKIKVYADAFGLTRPKANKDVADAREAMQREMQEKGR